VSNDFSTPAWERFNNRILSITPAEPGWQVETQLLTIEGGKTTVDEKGTFPVVLWAVVESVGRDGIASTRVEPVFYEGSSLITATECRRLNSDVDPQPGDPKQLVRIDLKRQDA
jgi:hypothetical protein